MRSLDILVLFPLYIFAWVVGWVREKGLGLGVVGEGCTGGFG